MTEPARVWPRSSTYMLWLFSLGFLWNSKQWEGVSLTLLPVCGTLLLLLGCLIQPSYEGLYIVLFPHVVPSSVDIPRGLLFSEWKWRDGGSSGEGMLVGRTAGGAVVVRMREEYLNDRKIIIWDKKKWKEKRKKGSSKLHLLWENEALTCVLEPWEMQEKRKTEVRMNHVSFFNIKRSKNKC